MDTSAKGRDQGVAMRFEQILGIAHRFAVTGGELIRVGANLVRQRYRYCAVRTEFQETLLSQPTSKQRARIGKKWERAACVYSDALYAWEAALERYHVEYDAA